MLCLQQMSTNNNRDADNGKPLAREMSVREGSSDSTADSAYFPIQVEEKITKDGTHRFRLICRNNKKAIGIITALISIFSTILFVEKS